MNLWKEKVAEKLSRLLGDSPSSSSSPSSPVAPLESPSAGRNLQHPAQGASLSIEFNSPKKSYLSSILSLLPAGNVSSNNNAQDVNSPSSAPQSAKTLAQKSYSRKWSLNDFTLEERPVERSESGTESGSDESLEASTNNHDYVPSHDMKWRDGNEETSSSSSSANYSRYFMDKSTFISPDLFEFFQSCLPNIIKGCKWFLLYSTWKHGISLRTLLRNSIDTEGPCLLIVGDREGAIFGGLLNSPLKPTAKRKYQGTNQTFVFTTIYGEPRLFRATGANKYYYLCMHDTLAFGGGGSFALCLDEDLLHGSSGPCDTFGNMCLACDPEFELKNVELWGFGHSSVRQT